MPDLSGLTDDQRSALHELNTAVLMHREAVERRLAAEQIETAAAHRIEDLGYRIAGVA